MFKNFFWTSLGIVVFLMAVTGPGMTECDQECEQNCDASCGPVMPGICYQECASGCGCSE